MADRLDHDALGRVVRRAVELDQDAAIDGEGLPVDAVVAAATEAGISAEAVRTSVALERLGPEPAGGRLDVIVGPKTVMAERAVDLAADEAFDRLDDWLTRGHHLRRQQRHHLWAEWHKRGDIAAGVQRKVRSAFGNASLGTIRTITAQVSVVDDSHSIVRIEADRSAGRVAYLTATGGFGAASLAGAAAVGVAAPPLAVVMVPGLAVAGLSARRSKRSALHLERKLARVLDQVNSGERPKSISAGMSRRIRK